MVSPGCPPLRAQAPLPQAWSQAELCEWGGGGTGTEPSVLGVSGHHLQVWASIKDSKSCLRSSFFCPRACLGQEAKEAHILNPCLWPCVCCPKQPLSPACLLSTFPARVAAPPGWFQRNVGLQGEGSAPRRPGAPPSSLSADLHGFVFFNLVPSGPRSVEGAVGQA